MTERHDHHGGLRAAIVAGLAGGAVLTGTTHADFTDAVVVRYSVQAEEADGTVVTVNVEDLYLLTDDPKDVDLNIYDLYLPTSGQVPYFQSQTGPGWNPTNIGGPFDTTALRYADSFVTIGGMDFGTTAPPQSPGAGGASQIDPFFGGNSVAYPIDRAGWYNSSPPTLQGIAGQTAAGLGVMIGRFAYDGDFTIVGAQLSATWNQGIGTPGAQAGFTVREFIDCNGNIVEDTVEINDPSVSPYAGATQWTTAEGGNGHWYAFIDEEMTRDAAAAWAAERGGYLVTFAEPGEKEFVLSLTDPFCCGNYVGGHQLNPGLEPAGSWVWDTGEPWSGVDWATNEPNDMSALTGGSEQYLVMFTFAKEFGRFNDNNGLNPRTFIVEWDDAADCNGNGVLDSCEIIEGSETDRNGNRVPDSCEALVVPDAYATIQSAVNAVPDGGLILVRPGTYQEHVNLGFGSATRQFVLASTDGAEATVIEGSAAVDESVLLARSGFDSRTRIEGFTIRGGETGHTNGDFDQGGGIFLANNGLSLWNCRFLSNEAPYGGNLYAFGFDGDIRECYFSGGRGFVDGGNVMIHGSTAVLAACELRGGTAINDGGGLKVVNGFVDVLECIIQANSAQTGGGVMYAETVGQATELNFVGSDVTLNSAKFGGGFWSTPDGDGPNLGTSVVCDNSPDNFFGPYTDLGDNEICVCVGDLNLDGEVDGTDLGLFLVYAGSDCDPGASCPGDLNGDGEISGADLGIMLGNWGLCQ